MVENQRICGSWRIFLKNSSSLNVQDKQGTREQLSLNKHTAVDHSDNNTVLGIKGVYTFEQGRIQLLFLLWTICKQLLCEISYSGQY